MPADRIAIAAHLHVLLRRKTGRVTDTEWMAANADYATEIVRFARMRAREDGHADLAEWADKLEAAMGTPLKVAPRPLAQVALQALQDRQRAAALPMPPVAPGIEPPPPPPAVPEHERTGGFEASQFAESSFHESTLDGKPRRPRDPNAPRYVGGIR